MKGLQDNENNTSIFFKLVINFCKDLAKPYLSNRVLKNARKLYVTLSSHKTCLSYHLRSKVRFPGLRKLRLRANILAGEVLPNMKSGIRLVATSRLSSHIGFEYCFERSRLRKIRKSAPNYFNSYCFSPIFG